MVLYARPKSICWHWTEPESATKKALLFSSCTRSRFCIYRKSFFLLVVGLFSIFCLKGFSAAKVICLGIDICKRLAGAGVSCSSTASCILHFYIYMYANGGTFPASDLNGKPEKHAKSERLMVRPLGLMAARKKLIIRFGLGLSEKLILLVCVRGKAGDTRRHVPIDNLRVLYSDGA